MEYAKVIEFPKERTIRKRFQDRVQEKKAALVLSIASVVLMTVFVNQRLIESADRGLVAKLTGVGRQVASIEQASLARDVKWEHDLAKRLNDEERLAVNLAERPTLRDELMFGYLQGKYGMKLSQGQISSLEFIGAQAGEVPMDIANKGQFLKQYASAFGNTFIEASLSPESKKDNDQVYNLINASKAIVGRAHFSIDSQGRVQTIRFTQ